MLKAADRVYHLPVATSCSESCDYCPGLGQLSQEKSIEQFQQSLAKAKSGEYTSVLLPCNFLFLPNYKDYLQQLAESGMAFTVQVNTKSIHSGWTEVFEQLQSYNCELMVIIDNQSQLSLEALHFLQRQQIAKQYTIVVRKGLNVEALIKALPPEVQEVVKFYFPYKLKSSDPYLSTREISKLLKSLSKSLPQFKVQTISGLDNFDPRVLPDMEFESNIEPLFSCQTATQNLSVSVVIPTYNNRLYVLNTLKHLLKQNMPAEKYEVVIVDDGSDDNTDKTLIEHLSHYKNQFNVKYIYFPRSRPRKMGDSQFRAGIARNLGVKHAAGDLLVFLDSDILTPENYLTELLSTHEKYDFVQTERVYLKRNVSDENTDFTKVDFVKDTYIPEGGYWEDFYRCQQPWQEMPFKWKYVCTYGLSVKRDVFKSLGWFRKNYIFYGFEDTDFGYRAHKAGLKFFKSPVKCLHLYHETERSEFSNSDFLRHELLKKTARIFFHNNPEPEIFEHFKSLVDEGLNLRDMAFKVKTKLMGSSFSNHS